MKNMDEMKGMNVMKNTGDKGGFKGMKYIGRIGNKLKRAAMAKEPGIDGILVTVGLCIIALLLCVVMKDSLTTFIQTIVTAMQQRANGILTGA